MSFASPIVTGSENNLRVSYGDDKGLLVEFVDDAIYQPHESEKEGRAIYKSTPFISIIIPGDKTKRPYRPATEEDKRRFPQQWAAYAAGSKAIADGTPITEWNYLSKSQALELKHIGFYTVELLANASDTQISGLVSGNLLREQAKTFIASTKDDSKYTSLVAENAKLSGDMKMLLEQNELLKGRLDALEGDKKPGRPRKSENN